MGKFLIACKEVLRAVENADYELLVALQACNLYVNTKLYCLVFLLSGQGSWRPLFGVCEFGVI